jgi:MFS family permease
VKRPAAAGPTTRQRVREVFASSGFRRLVATRVTSQLGDGLFQLATAKLLLFDDPGPNPALTLTILVAVTLIPFSVIMPFVGVFIDRWDRRKILERTPLARAALSAVLPLTALGGTEGPAFYAIALVVLSANRLFLATMSAVLPQLVPERDLLVANSIAATGGSIASVTGLGIGAAVAAAVGGRSGALVAACAFGGAALLARTLPVRRGMEPDKGPLLAELREVLSQLAEGARSVARRVRVRYALTAVVAGQLLVGVNTGTTAFVFISQLGLGVGSVSTLLGAIGVGLGIGVVLVPLVGRWVREDLIVALSFLLGGIAVLFTATSLTRTQLTIGAVFVGMSYAFAKIPVDTIVQEEMPDALRGRAFAAYDLLFNVARVAGTGIAAGAIAAEVRPETIVGVSSIGYLFASAALAVWARRISKA